MIHARDIRLSFGAQTVFDDISFNIDRRDRIGLVGRNGSGKTTLLKAIFDPTVLDTGNISIQNKQKIAYMPQEVVLESSRSVLDETLMAFHELVLLQDEAQKLEQQLTDGDQEVINRYAAVQEQLMALQPAALAARAKKILMGLGFAEQQFEAPVSTLSVGWKMRIVLAQLLLQDADYYLFDEPTNHLDLMAKEWFLQYLKTADCGFLLICHERYFLDELCTTIMELERGALAWYAGNYTQYVTKKEQAQKIREAAYAQQQKEIQRKQATIERFRAGTKSKMAASMEKALDKIDRVEIPDSLKTVHFRFPPLQPSGKLVLKVAHVSCAFGEKSIFKNISCEIEAGQKVALIAPNGRGKTTLLHMIAGILPLQQGSINFGYHVTRALFVQDQNKILNGQKTILENVNILCPKVPEQTIRTFLGAFLFSGDDVHKQVAVLSGGEKNRVGMVSVLLHQANFLLLDEPTNHLDIPSKEVLLKALQQFSGTVLFVSHDRDFVNSLATDIIELQADKAVHYRGNFDDYLYQKSVQEQQHGISSEVNSAVQRNMSSAKPTAPKLSDREHIKAVKKIEGIIEKLDASIRTLSESFAHISYGSPEFERSSQELVSLQKKLREAEAQWEQLHTNLS
jgi:ATP-binding cassette subfamily F protein 3